jgi:hypothetical protein
MPFTITTSSRRLDILDGSGATPAERAELDYINWPAVDEGTDSVSLVRYRGTLWDLGSMEPCVGSAMPPELAGWQAYLTQTYFSGVCFRYVTEDDETYVVADWYYASDS